MDFQLELVVLPVSDVDRAKAFYERLGWRPDADFAFDNGFRVVQFTPPGSGCSVQFGTDMTPGSVKGLHLVVDGIDEARTELLNRGVAIGDVVDVGGGVRYAWFADPDGNSLALQEMPWRTADSF